jgi:hypothetical protein
MTPSDGAGVAVDGRGVLEGGGCVEVATIRVLVTGGMGVCVMLGTLVGVGVGDETKTAGVELGIPSSIDPPRLKRLKITITLIISTAKA